MKKKAMILAIAILMTITSLACRTATETSVPAVAEKPAEVPVETIIMVPAPDSTVSVEAMPVPTERAVQPDATNGARDCNSAPEQTPPEPMENPVITGEPVSATPKPTIKTTSTPAMPTETPKPTKKPTPKPTHTPAPVETPNDDWYACGWCDEWFKTAEECNAHIGRAHSECSYCGAIFANQAQLDTHIESAHSTATPDATPKTYVCETCGKSFDSQDALNAHKLDHEYDWVCKECGKHFGNDYEAWYQHAWINPGHYNKPTPTESSMKS